MPKFVLYMLLAAIILVTGVQWIINTEGTSTIAGFYTGLSLLAAVKAGRHW